MALRIDEEKTKYLIVGAWNTFFGVSCFLVLNLFLKQTVHYIGILTVSYIISITNNFLSYKFFVFKSKGNYLREYLKFYVVYASTFLINIVLMAAFKEVFKMSTQVSFLVTFALVTMVSYLGHKRYTFRPSVD